MSEGGETNDNNTAMTGPDVDVADKKHVSESSGASSESQTKQGDDDSSTKATEENDSDDATMEAPTSSSSSDENKDGDDADDAGSTADDNTPEDNRTQEEKEKEAKEKEEAEKNRIEELKRRYKDWPLRNIKEPHDNDVMYGRGGGTNHHQGNKRYRQKVEDRKLTYVSSKRLDKPQVALAIIREWRAQIPPGRLLKQNDKTKKWDDVGDKKAREKTSQALREKAPQIREQVGNNGVSRITFNRLLPNNLLICGINVTVNFFLGRLVSLKNMSSFIN